jgi:hypothetical protein
MHNIWTVNPEIKFSANQNFYPKPFLKVTIALLFLQLGLEQLSDKKFFEIKCVVKLSYEKQTFGIGWGLICQSACRGCIRG